VDRGGIVEVEIQRKEYNKGKTGWGGSEKKKEQDVKFLAEAEVGEKMSPRKGGKRREKQTSPPKKWGAGPHKTNKEQAVTMAQGCRVHRLDGKVTTTHRSLKNRWLSVEGDDAQRSRYDTHLGF